MLRELNVDIIKLDAYFLRMEKNNERKGMHIIESVINMAKTMAMPVIVEGVETQEQCEFLVDLGIRYIQGYYFYKPMCAGDFEKLLSEVQNVDPNGFVFKANEEFRIREFLNDTVYSDSMLNHIIGPSAIYSLHGDDIDIIRFNQMFTFKKIDGSAARFLIYFYFLNEDGEQRRFYGSARDVTEITNLHRHMELLSRFTSRTVLFLLYSQGEYSFEVTAHGLEKDMGLSGRQLAEELNDGLFYKRLEPFSETILWNIAQRCAESREMTTTEFSMKGAGGETLDVVVDADYVDDELGDVKCILSMRKK